MNKARCPAETLNVPRAIWFADESEIEDCVPLARPPANSTFAVRNGGGGVRICPEEIAVPPGVVT